MNSVLVNMNSTPVTTEQAASVESSYFQAFKLLFELKAVALNPPKGIILAPPRNEDCISEIAGALFLDQGPWMGAVFQFHINLSCLYSNQAAEKCFAVKFSQQILHPFIDIVDNSAHIRLQTPTVAALEPGAVLLSILNDIQKLFVESMSNLQQNFRVVNKEAWKLYETNPTLFAERAAFAVRKSLEYIEKAPASMPMQFFAWNPTLDNVLKGIVTPTAAHEDKNV